MSQTSPTKEIMVSCLHLPPMVNLPVEFQLVNFLKLYHIVKVPRIIDYLLHTIRNAIMWFPVFKIWSADPQTSIDYSEAFYDWT